MRPVRRVLEAENGATALLENAEKEATKIQEEAAQLRAASADKYTSLSEIATAKLAAAEAMAEHVTTGRARGRRHHRRPPAPKPARCEPPPRPPSGLAEQERADALLASEELLAATKIESESLLGKARRFLEEARRRQEALASADADAATIIEEAAAEAGGHPGRR